MPRKSQLHDQVIDQLASVATIFAADASVTQGKMFGSTALKVNGKVFVILVKDKFVAKLPVNRIAELRRTLEAENFDPGHGKLMKEWVSISGHQERWIELAREAHQFVLGVPS